MTTTPYTSVLVGKWRAYAERITDVLESKHLTPDERATFRSNMRKLIGSDAYPARAGDGFDRELVKARTLIAGRGA